MNTNTILISEWLAKPHQVAVAEQQQVKELVDKYPYLVPARWMNAGADFAQSGFSKEMLETNELFNGNWLLFHTAVKQSVNELTIKPEAVLEAQVGSSEGIETAEVVLDEEESIILDEVLPAFNLENSSSEKEENLIQPLFIDNYFQHQGIAISDEIPAELDKAAAEEVDEKALMVMMGFDEWLLFLKKKNDAKKSDEEDKAVIRSIWQREKLAEAMGEEDDNIPEAVFEMAINSIDKHDIMVSEPLAEIHVKQGRFDKAIEIYRKLSLQNPEKKTYFAAKINHLNKENLS
ncbi:MAG: hypothetical protein WC716_02740 [Chitinophagaceae bacterium]|jgi:tetratricopeptide (TPR) repeat protein